MTPQESKINELLARIQARLIKIRGLQIENASDKTRIRIIEEGVKQISKLREENAKDREIIAEFEGRKAKGEG